MMVNIHEYILPRVRKEFLGADYLSVSQVKSDNTLSITVGIGKLLRTYTIGVNILLWVGCEEFLKSCHTKFVEDFEAYLRTGGLK